jgi:hypothetical protein
MDDPKAFPATGHDMCVGDPVNVGLFIIRNHTCKLDPVQNAEISGLSL